MLMKDYAERLGYKYNQKKTLVETDKKTFYARTDHTLTDAGGEVLIFRDKQSITMFLNSKEQIELPVKPRGK